eukprot:m.155465 g.155465  ORF g.155465 m.155465 type:complete len:51 (+) comp13325_c0_seq36:2169-2321(+)
MDLILIINCFNQMFYLFDNQFADIVKELHQFLRRGWQADRPSNTPFPPKR